MKTATPGSLKHVIVSNVVATNACIASIVAGIPGHDVEDVTLSNIRVRYEGAFPYAAPDAVPEQIAEYPESTMFGVLPAFGLYCRHAKGLVLNNVAFSVEQSMWRIVPPKKGERIHWPANAPAPEPSEPSTAGTSVVCDDVHGLDLDGFRSVGPGNDQPIVRLVNVSDALLRGCVAPEGTDAFLQVTGAHSGTISFRDNVMSRAKLAVGIGKEVDPEAIDLGDKSLRVEVR